MDNPQTQDESRFGRSSKENPEDALEHRMDGLDLSQFEDEFIASSIERLDELVETFEANDGALWLALHRIAEDPHRALRNVSPLVHPGEAEGIAPHLLGMTIMEPDAVSITFRKSHFRARGQKWRFLKVFDDRTELIYDTVPNRFVKYFLSSVATELRGLLRTFQSSELRANERVDEILRDARWVKGRVHGLIEPTSVLGGAQAMRRLPLGHLVLQHDPRYRQVRRAYLDLFGA